MKLPEPHKKLLCLYGVRAYWSPIRKRWNLRRAIDGSFLGYVNPSNVANNPFESWVERLPQFIKRKSREHATAE